MSQCLRCDKSCSSTSVLCDECWSLLNTHIVVSEPASKDVAHVPTAPLVALSSHDEQEAFANGDVPEHITAPNPAVQAPQTPLPSVHGDYANFVEQAMRKLSEAAQRIASSEQGMRRSPHASRLTPLRDISADIERHSTPMPKASTTDTRGRRQSKDLGKSLPDFWPWFHDIEADENDNDQWVNRTDPLIARHFPSSEEAARIEEEDMRRAWAAGISPSPAIRNQHYLHARRLRFAFLCLTVFAILALSIDGVLVSIAFLHPHRGTASALSDGPPTITLSSNIAGYGQSVTLHILHFAPSTQVFLTHDIGEPIQTSVGTKLIQVGADGSKDISILVDNSWQAGMHTIEAEDVTTRYTASAWLQIPAGSTPPPHLAIDRTQIDLGAGIVGANTIQPLTIHNFGSGTITWAASSDQAWLKLTPSHGSFSDNQTIAVGVERANLAVNSYVGKITFSSNVGPPLYVEVDMSVRPLPSMAGPVLTITPAVLSFTALDGGNNPAAQVLQVSNPGSQPLYWSLANNAPTMTTGQSAFLRSLGTTVNWLTMDQTSGTIVPGGTSIIHIIVHSQNLLPGTYLNTLVFTANQEALNSPQNVSVSLTIQPLCGLTLSTGTIIFNAVSGQSNPSSQVLGIAASPSCSGPVNWSATSSAPWLTITPSNGQARGTNSIPPTVSVNVNGLPSGPQPQVANILIITGQNTQSVMVLLTVQPPPAPTAPIMSASPLNLSFSTTQGQPSPGSQVVTITNTGGSTLQWHTAVNLLATSWLGASPTGGIIAAGQTGQVTVTINTSGLTPGNYAGQIILSGVDQNDVAAGGSPQTITVNLLVLPPCVLQQASSSALAFSATQGSSDPATQTASITASGNCSWPLNWKASVTSAASWLSLAPASGTFNASGQSATLTFTPTISGLTPGSYTTQVSIVANNASTAIQGSTQVISITLTVLPPCVLQVSSTSLAFTVPQGQSSASSQNLTVGESGNCARPVTWSATTDAGSSSWLVVSATPGTDNGNGGTVSVSVNASTTMPGTYTGTITILASGSGGAVVNSSPQTVTVTVTITGFKIGGIAYACSDASCTTQTALPGATLNLVNSSGTMVMSVTTGASGNFAFNNVPLGSYTVVASGTDTGGTNYTSSTSITVSADQRNLSVKLYTGS